MTHDEMMNILRNWLDGKTCIGNVQSIDTDYCNTGDVLIKTSDGDMYILSWTDIDPSEIDDI